MILLGWPSPATARRPLPEGEPKLAAQPHRPVFGGNWAADHAKNSKRQTRDSKRSSAARQRVLDQVVNMIEGDFVDAREDFESARRLVLEKYQDCGFHRRTTGLYARNLFNDDRRVGREG